jgi:hypothetical protein
MVASKSIRRLDAISLLAMAQAVQGLTAPNAHRRFSSPVSAAEGHGLKQVTDS